jgi:hydrogenase nickel incorporation protein HypA/HybF
MHEMGIAQQLVTIALDAIPDDIENPRVEKMNLRIGKLAAVVVHSLSFCLEVLTRDTPLEGAELIIDEVPVCLHCESCNHEWQTDTPAFGCPACKTGQVTMMSGREIEISSIEVTDD